MVISKKNSKKCAIVVSKYATPREEFAATELKKYIEKICDITIPICRDDNVNSDACFIIGGPKRNRMAEKYITCDEFNRTVPGPEGFMIKSVDDDHIILAGNEGVDLERGTIYAVYEMLERFLGCAFVAYSHPELDAGEYLPRQDEIVLEGLSYISKSSGHNFRAACVQYGDAPKLPRDMKLNIPFFDWLVKNRYNYIYLWTVCYEEYKELGLIDELIRRGIKFLIGHHDASDLFLPAYGNKYFPEKYYETHPEYYKLMKDGTRYRVENHCGQIVFCGRNMDMIEQLSQNIIEWLKYNPGVEIIQLAPHDGIYEQCCCELCKPYTKTENYMYYVNEVAKRVSSVYPNVKISAIIYVDIWECPANIELDKAVCIIEATWARAYSGLRTVGKEDGSSINGTEYEKNIMDWKATGASVVYYDYYMGIYGDMQCMIPMSDEIQAIDRRFTELGIDGASTQIECFNLWNYLFNFYSFGRTGYNHDLSMEDNLNSFVNIFGEGGEYIKQIVRECEATVDGQAKIGECGKYFIENVDKVKIYNLFDKALDSANTAFARNNTRLLRMAFRYSDLLIQDLKIKDYKDSDTLKSVLIIVDDLNPELKYMLRFDSLNQNNPGYGLAMACTATDDDLKDMSDCEEFTRDKWYSFE